MLGWRLTGVALGCALGFDIMATVTTINGVGGPQLLAGILAQAGGWLFLGLALYGVWRQTRWGLWLNGILAVVAIPLLVQSTLAPTLGGAELDNSPAQVALTWLEVLALAVSLIGIVMVFRSRPR